MSLQSFAEILQPTGQSVEALTFTISDDWLQGRSSYGGLQSAFALAAMVAVDAGWQCALMAPTEILATQHFAKLVGWLEPLGITTAWLTGSQKAKERREALAMIESGAAGLVVMYSAGFDHGTRFVDHGRRAGGRRRDGGGALL